MLDLKTPYDAMNKADEALKVQAAEIVALLDQGTDEAKQQALALQEPLNQLQNDYDQAKALYDSLVKANAPSNVAANFVPVSETPSTPDEEKPKDVMKRAEWNALSPDERAAFVNKGGAIED